MKIKKLKQPKIKEIKKDLKITVKSSGQSLEEEVKNQQTDDSRILSSSGFKAPILEQTEIPNNQVSTSRSTPSAGIEPEFVPYRSQNITIDEAARKYEVNTLSSNRTQSSSVLRPQVISDNSSSNNFQFQGDSRLHHSDRETTYYEPVKLDDVKAKRRNPWDG